MQLKICPICGNLPLQHFENGKHVIQCEHCIKNGFTIKAENPDLVKAIEIWNYREFFNRMLLDCDYFIDVLKQYSGYDYNDMCEINKDKRFKLYNNVFFNTVGATRGCLIDKDGNIIKCYESHKAIVLKRLGLTESLDENSEGATSIVKKAVNQGIFIRVTICGRHLAVEINSKTVNKKQTNALVDYVMNNKDKDLKDVISWNIFDLSDKSNLLYHDYTEFLSNVLFF